MSTDSINWDDPQAETVDGFTVAEIKDMVFDDVVSAVCSVCDAERLVEPDAKGYACFECDSPDSFTSPLVKLGLV